jgi:hypothetical protein
MQDLYTKFELQFNFSLNSWILEHVTGLVKCKKLYFLCSLFWYMQKSGASLHAGTYSKLEHKE